MIATSLLNFRRRQQEKNHVAPRVMPSWIIKKGKFEFIHFSRVHVERLFPFRDPTGLPDWREWPSRRLSGDDEHVHDSNVGSIKISVSI